MDYYAVLFCPGFDCGHRRCKYCCLERLHVNDADIVKLKEPSQTKPQNNSQSAKADSSPRRPELSMKYDIVEWNDDQQSKTPEDSRDANELLPPQATKPSSEGHVNEDCESDLSDAESVTGPESIWSANISISTLDSSIPGASLFNQGPASLSIQETASIEILTFLTKDAEFQELCREALKKLSQQRFIENFRRLLEHYCVDLKSMAQAPLERQAIRLLRKKTRWLATQISYEFQDNDDDGSRSTMRALVRQNVDKRLQLERFLAQANSKTDPSTADSAPEEETNSEGSDDSDEEEPDFENLKQIETFLTGGEAYFGLKKRLDDYIHPEIWKEAREPDSLGISPPDDISIEESVIADPNPPTPNLREAERETDREAETALKSGSKSGEHVDVSEPDQHSAVDCPSLVQTTSATAPWYRYLWNDFAESVANELAPGRLNDFLRKSSSEPITEGESRFSWTCVSRVASPDMEYRELITIRHVGKVYKRMLCVSHQVRLGSFYKTWLKISALHNQQPFLNMIQPPKSVACRLRLYHKTTLRRLSRPWPQSLVSNCPPRRHL